MLALPKLESQQIPHNLAVEVRLPRVQCRNSVEELWTKDAALARSRIVHDVVKQLLHARLLQQPLGERHSEAVFLLVEHLGGKNIFHGLFENVAFLKAFELQAGGNTARKLGEPGIEKRITHVDASDFRCARDLS